MTSEYSFGPSESPRPFSSGPPRPPARSCGVGPPAGVAVDAAALLEPHRSSLTQRDVVVGPNAGLELLPRDSAFDKLLHARYLVEKLSGEWEWAS